jgi:ABC-2 type transport system ATP-binding protein
VEAACASEQALLRVDSINKQYADQVVLANVAFDIQAGEIIGIVGPNGAGKTTLLEVLAGILPAETSDVRWLGTPLPPSRRREAMFYLPDGVRPYQDQPVTQVLLFFADVYRRSPDEVANTIESVGLTPVLHKRVHSLSKGYGRRLMLALGLLTPHPLLLMDEPFDGLICGKLATSSACCAGKQARIGRLSLRSINYRMPNGFVTASFYLPMAEFVVGER